MAFDFSGVFGKGSTTQTIFLWGVLGEVIAALGEPGFTALRQLVNSIEPVTALSVADSIDAAIKGHLDEHTAQVEASYSGIDERRFRVLLAAAGEPPGLEFLLEAFRRQFIPQAGRGAESVSLEQGIRESRLKDKWIPVVERMGLRPLAVSDAIDAWVEGQIPAEQAQEIAYQNGISREDALVLFHTRGRPPDPSELIEMVRRGKIPSRGTGPDALSLQQGIFESAVKDKWEPVFEELLVAVPPPRTVVALIRAGTISDADGARFLQDAGLSPELAAAYVAEAHHTKNQAERKLTETQVLDLYEAQFFSAEVASRLLQDLGSSENDAAELLAYRDLQRELKAVNAATSRIGALYIAHKIDQSQAVASLGSLQVPPAQVSELIRVWDVERAATVKVLTPAEIVAAWRYEIFDQATATQELVQQGFTEFDAWALLSIRNRAPLAGRPAG